MIFLGQESFPLGHLVEHVDAHLVTSGGVIRREKLVRDPQGELGAHHGGTQETIRALLCSRVM